MIETHSWAAAVVAAATAASMACTGGGGGGDPDLDAARNFTRHPLYWVGERLGLPVGALRALRSANDVAPVIDADDPLPAAPRAVLAGRAPCSA